MNKKIILKIRFNNSQPDLSFNLNSRNELNSLNQTRNTTFSLNKQSLRKNFNKRNKLTDSSKSQILSNSSFLYNKNISVNHEKENNNNESNFSFIISKNNFASFPKIIIPKKDSQSNIISNKTSFDEVLIKNESFTQSKKSKADRNHIKIGTNIKEKLSKKELNKTYYSIFPKHIKEKPIEKITEINNLYNYYCCNNNEQFQQMIYKENLKRKKFNKSLIKLALKNDDTKTKIKILRNKSTFIGSLVNYCYPRVFAYKIKQKTKELRENQKKLFLNYIVPTKQADLLKKRENDKITSDLINNSFYIINNNNSKIKDDIIFQ